MSDATPSVLVDDDCSSVPDLLDCNDLLESLLATARVAVHADRRLTQRCIRRAATLLGLDLSPGREGAAEHCRPLEGLASWQVKRLKSYIDERLGSTIRATDLAGLVRMSTSHFHRGFSKVFGESPMVYVRKRRMRRAQELMLNSRVSLSQVALECGMSDQAHFSRVSPNCRNQSPGLAAPAGVRRTNESPYSITKRPCVVEFAIGATLPFLEIRIQAFPSYQSQCGAQRIYCDGSAQSYLQ